MLSPDWIKLAGIPKKNIFCRRISGSVRVTLSVLFAIIYCRHLITAWTQMLQRAFGPEPPAVWTHLNCDGESAGGADRWACTQTPPCNLHLKHIYFCVCSVEQMSPHHFGVFFSIWDACCPWKRWVQIIKKVFLFSRYLSLPGHFPFNVKQVTFSNASFFPALQLWCFCVQPSQPGGRRLSEIIPSWSARLTDPLNKSNRLLLWICDVSCSWLVLRAGSTFKHVLLCVCKRKYWVWKLRTVESSPAGLTASGWMWKSSDESQLWFWETILNKWERLLSISVFPGSFLRRHLHKMKHLFQRKSGGRQKKMFPGE